jgi:hypothetical protein
MVQLGHLRLDAITGDPNSAEQTHIMLGIWLPVAQLNSSRHIPEASNKSTATAHIPLSKTHTHSHSGFSSSSALSRAFMLFRAAAKPEHGAWPPSGLDTIKDNPNSADQTHILLGIWRLVAQLTNNRHN